MKEATKIVFFSFFFFFKEAAIQITALSAICPNNIKKSAHLDFLLFLNFSLGTANSSLSLFQSPSSFLCLDLASFLFSV